ncbi:MAG TPA: CHAT domain-containing protein [Methylomirabilota bacterium]|nr:CHAT domain-containing protein [Methylomirabilota bacterium]
MGSRLRAAGALALVLALAATAAAQGGRGGKGRHRAPHPPPASEQSREEYPLVGPEVLDAIDRGEARQALAFYERAAAQAEQQGDALRAARAWHAISLVTVRQGRFQKAIQAAERSIGHFKTARGLTQADFGAWASAQSQLGSAYRAVGDLARARAALEGGLEVARNNLRGRHESHAEGYLLNGLAMIAYAQQDYRTAITRHTEALQFLEAAERRLGPRAPDRARVKLRRWIAHALFGIGRAHLVLGHLDEADAAFDRGLKAARRTGLRETELELLAGQGRLALMRQDWTKALDLYRQAVTLSGQINQTRGVAALYQGQSRALVGLGRTGEAFAAAREAVRYIEEIRADLGDPTLRSSFFEDRQGIYRQAVYLGLQAQQPAEAFALAERSRARTFLDLLGNQTTLSKGRTKALVDEEVQLRARLAEAEAQEAGAEEDDAERRPGLVEALERDYRAFLERLRKESLEQASLMAVEPVTLPEIQALLPEGTTLLEYEVGDGGIVVWVVERGRFAVVRLPGDRSTLLGMIRRYRAAVGGQAPIAEVEAQAQALYRRLIGPALEQIRGRRLVIVPHGPLHYLPFAALRSPAGRWLVEDFTLSVLPSASVLRFLVDKGAGAPARALVIGNPDLGPALALPWAEREARLVGQREPDATVLVRGAATEAEVKRLVESVGLVHFATHGELSEEDPLASAVLLVPGGGEDGRLEVREVFGLDLHARLVVLSACETGLGKLSRGDELVGLQRGFLYAGTPAVITTLWKVDDRASYELVRAFYGRLAAAGPVEALRQAQLDAVRAYPHPFAWAAFEITAP